MRLLILGLAMIAVPSAFSQTRPYIGYAYPAGGQQGTTFTVLIGGQGYDEITGATVSGQGVTAKLHEYFRSYNNQEEALLSEQARELRKIKPTGIPEDIVRSNMVVEIEKRTRARVTTPQCRSISTLAWFKVTVAPDAPPGEREIRLVTLRGVSNPLVFYIGQVPENTRPAMRTSQLQVLGKEAQALRKRPPEEAEARVTIPCTMNGQIASGEVNAYRFTATKGQRLVITTLGRQLIPFIADAVPGWFQPVIALYDATGKEVAYDDDYRFKPDPTIFYEVPKDGEYVLTIRDSIYRGREDFVYRITVGELPFVTSIFPLGGRVGEPVSIKMKGWNVQDAELPSPAKDATAGIHPITANRKGIASNRLFFELDTLPEVFDREPNDTPSRAQKVTLPVIVNGHIDKTDDWDVFQFTGKAGDTVVAEVSARKLDSPLDSVIKLTDAKGTLIALNDDREDISAGLNTHHADSYIMTKLPADGIYCVHIGDTARNGGDDYAYRLRISAPRPDFALRVRPSSLSLRSKSPGQLGVIALYKDGFSAPIKLSFKNPPEGITNQFASMVNTQGTGLLSFRANMTDTKGPIPLTVVGRAKVGDREIVNEAVPAEDRMQAFLWRHLVPAKEFNLLVFNPDAMIPPVKVAPTPPLPDPSLKPPAETKTNTVASATGTNALAAAKFKFTKQQVAGRLRELKRLYEEGLLTDKFYFAKVAECEANAQ